MFIALFAMLIRWMIGFDIPESGAADRVAAGVGGDGEVYASAFRWSLALMMALTAVTIAFVAILHRKSLRQGEAARS